MNFHPARDNLKYKLARVFSEYSILRLNVSVEDQGIRSRVFSEFDKVLKKRSTGKSGIPMDHDVDMIAYLEEHALDVDYTQVFCTLDLAFNAYRHEYPGV